MSSWYAQNGSVCASPPHLQLNALPASQPSTGGGVVSSSSVGTRHAFVHPFALITRPSAAVLSGQTSLDAHAPQSIPVHPAGHDSAPGASATQCAQLAGCGLFIVHGTEPCLHGGSL